MATQHQHTLAHQLRLLTIILSADLTLRCAHRPQAQLLRRTYADAQLAGALGSCGGSSRRLLCYSEEHFRQLQPAALQQLDQPEHEEALLRALLGTVLVVKGRQAGDGSGAGAGGAAQQAALLRQLQEQQLVAAAMDEALGRRLLPVAGSSAIELAVAPEVRLGLWQHLQLLAARLRMQVQVLVQREGRSGSAAGAATWVVVEPDGAGEWLSLGQSACHQVLPACLPASMSCLPACRLPAWPCLPVGASKPT